LRSKITMCEDNLMGLREHPIEKTFDVAFWCMLLVGVKKCCIEISLRLERTFPNNNQSWVKPSRFLDAKPLSGDVDRL
jgi:hypothetical protein